MMLAVEPRAVRASECEREFVIESEKDAMAALMAANRWIGINERDELKAYATLSKLIEKEISTCPECNGIGEVMRPEWRRFWAEYGHLKGYEFGAALEEKAPAMSEEMTCPRCGGTGRVLSERGKRVAEAVSALYNKLLNAKGV